MKVVLGPPQGSESLHRRASVEVRLPLQLSLEGRRVVLQGELALPVDAIDQVLEHHFQSAVPYILSTTLNSCLQQVVVWRM